MDNKKCENCIWFDQHGQGEPCKYYDPVSDEEFDVDDEDAYELDLRERQELYMKQVEEQDS